MEEMTINRTIGGLDQELYREAVKQDKTIRPAEERGSGSRKEELQPKMFDLSEDCKGGDVKETGIIMSGDHPKLILEGLKTMTRRTWGLEEINKDPDNWIWLEGSSMVNRGRFTFHNSKEDSILVIKCPYGHVGDRLWVTQGISSSKSIPLEERFWSRIIKFDDHWEWMGHTNRKKYGLTRWQGKCWSTHRLMWKLQNGDIPAPKHVLHKCDMPWCVNPEHLYLGTNDDNIADKMARGRMSRQTGESNPQAKLTWEQVEEIQSLYWERWLYQHEIAERFHISQSQVSRIVHDKRWQVDTETPLPVFGHRTLEITEVRAERLREITNEDAKAEGVTPMTCCLPGAAHYIIPFHNLWDSLNAKRGYGWEVNPFVWVISFKV